jgi:hypothetical protein
VRLVMQPARKKAVQARGNSATQREAVQSSAVAKRDRTSEVEGDGSGIEDDVG